MKVNKKQISFAVVALLGIVAICVLFANAITIKMGSESEGVANGFKYMFGDSDKKLDFNFMAFLPFLLVIVGLVGAVLGLLGHKFGGFIALGAFAVAGILFFCYAAFFSMSGDSAKALIDLVDGANKLKKGTAAIKLGAAPIMAGIFSLLAAALSAAATFFIKK